MKTALRLAAVAILGILLWGKYADVHQRLAGQRDTIAKQWILVEDAMKMRADSVLAAVAAFPNISPSGALGTISAARGDLTSARTPQEKIAVYDRLDGAIANLLAEVQEGARQKSNGPLMHLQDEISNTENDVNVERSKYNEALQTYNTALQLFPNNVVAALSGFSRNDAYFKTEPGAGKAPKM